MCVINNVCHLFYLLAHFLPRICLTLIKLIYMDSFDVNCANILFSEECDLFFIDRYV